MKTFYIIIIFASILIACSNYSSSEDELPDISNPEPSKILVTTLTNIEAFDAIDFGSDGYLYAANYSKDIVYKIDKNGNQEVFASNQDGAAGIDFDSLGNMYLARYDASDIVVISSSGELKSIYENELYGPIGVELDADGNLFVSNHLAFFVSKIDTEGKLTRLAIPNFPNSSSLTLDHSGNIYVTSYVDGRIIKIDSETGAVSNFISLPVSGLGYITYANNELYATNIIGNLVYRITMSGSFEIIVGTGEAGYKDGPGNFAKLTRPLGITTNLAGDTLYVADSKTIRIITNFLD